MGTFLLLVEEGIGGKCLYGVSPDVSALSFDAG